MNFISIIFFKCERMLTTVVSLKGKKNEWGPSLEYAPSNLVYIGRRMYMGGWNLEGSPFGNPFRGENACQKYKKYISSNKRLLSKLSGLKGKLLACWCAPKPCHGDILRELIEGFIPGKIFCAKLPTRQDRAKGRGKWPIRKVQGIECYNKNCSSGDRTLKEVSPFYLVPEPFKEILPDGNKVERRVTCIENLWQASKVELKYYRGDENGFGKPPPRKWWERRNKIWLDPKPHRHVIPKSDRVNPNRAYVYWNGKYYPYEEARKLIYIPFYAEAVVKTKVYQQLEDMIKRGHNIQILGPDGRDFKDLETELEDPTKPFGHELVLVGLLRGKRVWEKSGKISIIFMVNGKEI